MEFASSSPKCSINPGDETLAEKAQSGARCPAGTMRGGEAGFDIASCTLTKVDRNDWAKGISRKRRISSSLGLFTPEG
ncbi:hypothetical protein NDU88_003146 [Pleurodeles waltl]|uniref:Uncharacterized protein n=1 Tax=Pleurodeles waltl TaxID=8319 RepID=A0AAV7WN81_PLEWA|nr:hypothetical protein NDU88_003146 [Pleurodeles waltl]